jgi:hypothetical protein
MMKALREVDCSEIEAPILVVSGESRSAKDWTDPKVILESAPDARGLDLPGVGRLVWMSPEVDGMNAEIADFLRDASVGDVVGAVD